jgi:hypothetical protein
MLFVESRELGHRPGEAERPRVLDLLARRGYRPLISSSRLLLLERLLGGASGAASELAGEMERELAERGGGPPTLGDLFCFSDHVFYLLFREAGVRVGFAHAGGLSAPDESFARFCREVEAALPSPHTAGGVEVVWPSPSTSLVHAQTPAWQQLAPASDVSAPPTPVAAALEDDSARRLLRRLRDAGGGPLPAAAKTQALGAVAERLIEAGLLQRDITVSCRKTGHALLNLPAADSLALITASRARCGLCASQVADEVVAETLNPTDLALTLLDGAAWLRARLLDILSGLGLPGRQIVGGEMTEHGEAVLTADVCGDRFLFFLRDGDLTVDVTRRVIAVAADADPSHVVAVATGEVEDGGRLRLLEFSWRRARDGRNTGVTVLEGLGAARAEIGRAFQAAARRRLTRELSVLDPAVGFSAAALVIGKFELGAAPLPAPEAAHEDLREGALSNGESPLQLTRWE